MRRDLCRRGPVNPLLSEMIFDLFSAWARRFKIFPGIASDLRLTVFAALQFVAEPFEAQSQFRAVNSRDVTLRFEDLMRLQRPCLAVLLFGDIEDHGMCVQLRSCVTVYGSSRVVFESRSNEFAACLRIMNIPDACLGVLLQFRESRPNALPMRYPHPLVTANQRTDRNGFRGGERSIPTGAMFDAGDFFAVFTFVCP